MTIPGIGPMCATTIQAFASPMEELSNRRDFAARVAVFCLGGSRPVGGKSCVEIQKPKTTY